MDCHVITPQTDIACQIVFSHCHGNIDSLRGGFLLFFGNDFPFNFYDMGPFFPLTETKLKTIRQT